MPRPTRRADARPAERARRLADLDDLRRARRRSVPGPLRPRPHPRRPARRLRRPPARHRDRGAGQGRGPHPPAAAPGQAHVRDRARPVGVVQLFVDRQGLGEERSTTFDAARPRRLGGRRRHRDDHPQGRALGERRRLPAPGQVAAPAARQVARPLRRRHPLPPALRRPHRERRRAAGVRDPVRRGRRHPQRARGRTASSRSRRRCSATSSAARPRDPFATHHNALDVDLYLRIAPELHLKRLVVGGFERVFEIGRVFRNEGVDTSHNPEFTMLEAYQAFADYHDMMELTERLVVAAARAVARRRHRARAARVRRVDLAEPWPRATMVELIREHGGVDINPSMSVDDRAAVLDRLGLTYRTEWGAGRLTMAVYDELVEPKLIRPTFVLDHPRETSPLARVHRDDPNLVERFEVVVERLRTGQRLQRAQRSDRPAGPLRGRGPGACRRRRRSGHRRRGLPASARVRPPAHRGHGARASIA